METSRNDNQAPDQGAQIRMHQDEIHIDIPLVQRLLAEQFPHLADLPVAPLKSTGTVNAIYRLGSDLYVRLPRIKSWDKALVKEWTWLPKLAPSLSLNIPIPLAQGRPEEWYPTPWAIYHWIEGSIYRDELVADEGQAAIDLANFILELRQLNMTWAPRGGRSPLAELDLDTRAAIKASGSVIDQQAASVAWERALAAPAWDGKPVWIHGDLLRPNLLVKDGRLCAVIDFGGVGIGDPAADVVPAWSVFNRPGRETFRQALAVDEETWARARGYALHQALLIIPYYALTNPDFVTEAVRTVAEVLGDQ